MLSTMHRAAPQHGRVLIMEEVVPGPETPHFSKLFDMHMLIMLTGQGKDPGGICWTAGRGWMGSRQTWYPAAKMLGVVEGVKA